jgi:hypothetical protein
MEDRAVRAQQLLDDDLLKEILDRLEKDSVNTALGANFEPDKCVSAVAYMQAAFEIRQRLQSAANSAKKARPQVVA